MGLTSLCNLSNSFNPSQMASTINSIQRFFGKRTSEEMVRLSDHNLFVVINFLVNHFVMKG
jgi:hypothetical protein